MRIDNVYTVILAAILPAFFLLGYVYWKDKYQREPISQILKGFALGIVSAGIAYVLELMVGIFISSNPTTWLGAILKAFCGAAIPEEFAKLTMLCLLLRRNKYFNERFDGIVYAVCIGMGFAATENIIYLFTNLDSWQSVAVSRALFSVPGHFAFAVVMGYYYSLVYFREKPVNQKYHILWMPVLMHGIYDSFLFIAGTGTMWSGIILMLFYIFCFKLYKYAKKLIEERLEQDKSGSLVVEDVIVNSPEYQEESRRSWWKLVVWVAVGILGLWLLIGIVAVAVRPESEEEDEEIQVTIIETNRVAYPGRTIKYSEKFRDNNPCHLNVAKVCGLTTPPSTRAVAEQMVDQLQQIETCDNYIVDPLTHSVPYLVPTAAKRLDSIGMEFADILQRNGLPHYRFYVTSMLRTQEDIDALQRTNGNSVKNSAHNYGTTFDLAYMRYDKVTPTADYMTEDNLKLVLGQVLLNQQRAGKIYVKYEYKQSCFHVTARK